MVACVVLMGVAGTLPDVFFVLSLYTIQAAGFVSLNIALIPVALAAMLLGGVVFIACGCCACGRRTFRPMLRLMAEPVRAHVPPVVDLLQNRVHVQSLNRAIFLYPICIVTAFVLGGSALIGPASLRAPFLSKDFVPEDLHLVAHCQAPLTGRLEGLAASGLAMANSLAHSAVTSSPVEIGALLATAAGAQPGAMSRKLLSATWDLFLMPLGETCGDGETVPMGAKMPATAAELACPSDVRGEQCLQLPPLSFSVVGPDGEPNPAYAGRVFLKVDLVGSPAGCTTGSSTDIGGLAKAATPRNGSAAFEHAYLVSHEGAALCAGTYKLRVEIDGRPEVFKIVRLVVAPPPAASLARSELVHMWPGYAPTSNLSATASNTTIVTERGAKRVTSTITTSTVTTGADGGTKITTTTSVEARDAAQLLAFTRPPPTDIAVGVPFRVSLHMSTETGWPLAGEPVQAVLLAAKGTGVRLIGPSSNVTDEAGNVHFNLQFATGASGRYMLLFGSAATFAFGGVADVVDALRTSAISIAEQVAQAGVSAATSVAGSLATQAGGLASKARDAASDVTGGLRGTSKGAMAGARRRFATRSAVRLHAERTAHHHRAIEAVNLHARRELGMPELDAVQQAAATAASGNGVAGQPPLMEAFTAVLSAWNDKLGEMEAADAISGSLGNNITGAAADKAEGMGAMADSMLASLLATSADASVLSRLHSADEQLQQCLSLANVADMALAAPGGQLKSAIGGLFGSISLPQLGQVANVEGGLRAAMAAMADMAPTLDVAGLFADATALANGTMAQVAAAKSRLAELQSRSLVEAAAGGVLSEEDEEEMLALKHTIAISVAKQASDAQGLAPFSAVSTLAEYTGKVKALMARGSEHALNASELAELSFFKSVGAALAQAVVDPHAAIKLLNGTLNNLRDAGYHAELPPLDDLTDEASQELVDAQVRARKFYKAGMQLRTMIEQMPDPMDMLGNLNINLGGVIGTAKGALGNASGLVNGLLGKVDGLAGCAGLDNLGGLQDAATQGFGLISNLLQDPSGAGAQDALASIASGFSGMPPAVQQAMQGFLGTADAAGEGAAGGLQGLPGSLQGLVQGVQSGDPSSIMSAGMGAMAGIFGGAMDASADINNMANSFASLQNGGDFGDLMGLLGNSKDMLEGVQATVTGILGQYGLSGNVLEDALGLPKAVASAVEEGSAMALHAGASAEEQAKAALSSNTTKAALGIVFGALEASEELKSDPMSAATAALDKGQTTIQNLMAGLGASASMRLPASSHFSLDSVINGSSPLNMSDHSGVASAACYQVATGTATLASTMLEGLANAHDLAALQTSGLQMLVALAEKWAPMKAALDFLAQFFPQLNALRGILPAADPNAPATTPAKGLDLSGLFNASGINASALVNATAVAARAAKHAAEARAAGGDFAAAAMQEAAPYVPEDGVSDALAGVLGGLHKQVMANVSSFDLKSAVTLSANMSDITPEVLLAMRQKVADAAGVPLSAVTASKQAAMKLAVKLLGDAPSVRIGFTITVPDAAAADKVLKAVGAQLADPAAASKLLSTDALPVTVDSIAAPPALSALRDAAAAVANGELPSIDAGLADTLAAMMPSDWKGMLRTLAMNVLESAAGSMAPKASMVLLKGDAQAVAKVASAHLSAPIVGFGASLGGAGSSTARTVPGDETQAPISTCAALGYPHYEQMAGTRGAPFWQPRAVAPYNWLLNAGEYPDGSPRRFCPIQRHLVGQSHYSEVHVDPGRLWGRAHLPRAMVEQSPPTEAQEAAYAQMSDAQLQAQDVALDELEQDVCPVDNLQLMRTEQMALCRESFVATGQTVASTTSRYDHLLDLPDVEAQAASSPDRSAGDGRVRVTARDAHGNPLAGRYCNVTDLSDDGYDLLPLTLSYTCGPSGADGVMLLENLQVSGGASRRLKLVVRVDGVLARAAPDAPWAFDTSLSYVSSAQPSFQHTGMLSLGVLGTNDADAHNNHDSIMLLSFFGLAVLAINAVSLDPHCQDDGAVITRKPPFFLRMLGMLALLVLVQTNAALWAHMVTTTDSGHSVVAIGLRDMIAMQHGADAPMAAIVLGGATIALATFILGLVTVLYLRSAKREYQRAQRLVQNAADGLPRTLAGRYYKALKTKLTGNGKGLEGSTVVAVAPAAPPPQSALRARWSACVGGLRRGGAGFAELCRRTWSILSYLSARPRAAWRRRFPLPICQGREGDGALEVGTWYESHAHARQRTSRNHVRLMLRGGLNEHPAMVAKQEALNRRTWQQFWRGCCGTRLDVDVAAEYDQQAVFYYPERLYMGLWLSAWLQVLLAAVVFSMAAWADGVVLYAQQKATQTLENAASASLGDAGHTSPVELAFNLLVAEAGKYFAVYIATIQAIFGEGFLRPFAIAIGVIQLAYVLSLWRGIFVRYRTRLLRMRRGDYFFKREEFRESGSSMFIGYQVAFIAVVSIIFFWVAVGIVCLFAVVFIAAKGVFVTLVVGVDTPEGAKDFDDPFFEDFGPVNAAARSLHTEEYPVHSSGHHSSGLAYVSNLLAGATGDPILTPAQLKGSVHKVYNKLNMGSIGLPVFLVAVVLPLFFQLFMNRAIFFVKGAGRTGGGFGNVWVRFRFWYAIYEMVMIMPNFLIGFYMLMYRLVMSFILNLYYAPALDVCIFPEPTGWSKWEVGFCTYIALIRTDHRYTSPVNTVFFDVLLEMLSTNRLQRGRQKLRRELVKRTVARSFEKRDGGGEGGAGGGAEGALSPRGGGFFDGITLDGIFGGRDAAKKAASDAVGTWESLDGQLTKFERFVRSPEYLRARNRWQLARMLLANPGLRRYRYHRLSTYDLPPVNNPYARFRQKLKHRFSETDRGLAKTRDGCVPALKALPATLKGLPQRAQEGGKALAEKARALPQRAQEGGKALAEKARACPAPAWKAADDIKALARGVPPAAKEAADATVTKAAVDEPAGAAEQGVDLRVGLLQRTKKQE